VTAALQRGPLSRHRLDGSDWAAYSCREGLFERHCGQVALLALVAWCTVIRGATLSR
jgi:hypothetical protein